MFLGSMTCVTSRLKSWLGFNDKADPTTTDRKLPVVGQLSGHHFDRFPSVGFECCEVPTSRSPGPPKSRSPEGLAPF
jgi:hypothetical protein